MKIQIHVFLLLILGMCISGCRKTLRDNNSLSEAMQSTTIRPYEPEMVAPGIISTAAFEGHATLMPGNNTMYFAIYSNDHEYCTIAYSEKKNGNWQKPVIASFSGKYADGSPCITPDGSRLFFSSKRPVQGEQSLEDYDVWYVERISNGWGNPIHLEAPINSDYREFSPAVSSDGTLYFCSDRPGGYGLCDVYVSRRVNDTYAPPENLGDSINTQYHEGNVGITPDGSVLFFMVQFKPGDFGADDIHYSLKAGNRWTKSKNIGSIINTYTFDFAPKVTPDSKYLYFSSRINARFTRKKDEPDFTYETFLQKLNSPLNGFGNIYTIELNKLNLK